MCTGTMYYCLICERKYKTNESYNFHLSRNYHKTKLMKLESLYGLKDPDSDDYKQWTDTKHKYNTPKHLKKKE